MDGAWVTVRGTCAGCTANRYDIEKYRLVIQRGVAKYREHCIRKVCFLYNYYWNKLTSTNHSTYGSCGHAVKRFGFNEVLFQVDDPAWNRGWDLGLAMTSGAAAC